jgi:methionine-R-sulfoxide reductase
MGDERTRPKVDIPPSHTILCRVDIPLPMKLRLPCILPRYTTAAILRTTLLSSLLLGAAAVDLAAASPEKPDSGSPSKTEPASKAVTKDSKEDLKKKLTPLQYDVTCNAATEPPFRNAYWNNHAAGLYVDVIDGEPLFTSSHKFDSGTGWPSFFQPVHKESILEKEDRSHNMLRVEVISKKSGAHLGHLFPDGPKPTGMRYCINSASLKFIPVADLDKEGYGKYRSLIEEPAPAAAPKK